MISLIETRDTNLSTLIVYRTASLRGRIRPWGNLDSGNTDLYEQAKHEMFKIVEYYNNGRRHSSLNYLTLIQYYRENPEEILRMRESKIERARILRRERNMKERNGGETAGTISLVLFMNSSQLRKAVRV